MAVGRAAAVTAFELLGPDDPRLVAGHGLAVAASQLRAADLEGEGPQRARAEVLAFLDQHADAAHRSCRAGHLTGSGLVVDASGTRSLLMLHRKLGRWFQPGGHADGDTNLAAVAWREASEETGIAGLRVAVPAIDIDVHLVSPPGDEPHLHLDLRFLVIAPEGAREQANDESLALRWVDEEGLEALDPPVDPSTRRLLRRGLTVASVLRRGGPG